MMADEVLFEFLHMELVALIHRDAVKDEKDGCIAKLESIGFRVGQSLIERFTKDCSRFKDELDTMKFICKDFWNSVYKKQIDNLRTNHQGKGWESEDGLVSSGTGFNILCHSWHKM
nr:hypothetical protein BaRGS_011099 [Batillaria attramentaria]